MIGSGGKTTIADLEPGEGERGMGIDRKRRKRGGKSEPKREGARRGGRIGRGGVMRKRVDLNGVGGRKLSECREIDL
jgi:hypothetical protein